MASQQHSTPPRARAGRTGLRSALWLPLFDDLADPAVVVRLAAEAEEAGWHGVFVWDHLRWRAPVQQAADPWITLAAIATATEHVRLGPMVTPLARRRPAKVARETATLDRHIADAGKQQQYGANDGRGPPARSRFQLARVVAAHLLLPRTARVPPAAAVGVGCHR